MVDVPTGQSSKYAEPSDKPNVPQHQPPEPLSRSGKPFSEWDEQNSFNQSGPPLKKARVGSGTAAEIISGDNGRGNRAPESEPESEQEIALVPEQEIEPAPEPKLEQEITLVSEQEIEPAPKPEVTSAQAGPMGVKDGVDSKIGRFAYVPYCCVPVVEDEFLANDFFQAAFQQWKSELSAHNLDYVYQHKFSAAPKYEGNIYAIKFGSMNKGEEPRLYVAKIPTCNENAFQMLGVEQFHWWTFFTGSGERFSSFRRRGSKQQLEIGIPTSAKCRTERLKVIKKWLDDYLVTHPGEILILSQTGVRPPDAHLQRYYDRSRYALAVNQDGDCLMGALVHSIMVTVSREKVVEWIPYIRAKFNCARCAAVRLFCCDHKLSIRIRKLPWRHHKTFESDPLGYLLCDLASTSVLYVESSGTPRYAFVVDAVNSLVWDDLEPHPMTLCRDVLEQIASKAVGSKNMGGDRVNAQVVVKASSKS